MFFKISKYNPPENSFLEHGYFLARKFLKLGSSASLVSKKKFSGGFSLMELVLTIAIFSIGSFAIAYVLIDANTTTQTVSYRTEAMLLAREGLEVARAIRDASWGGLTTGGPYGLSTSTGNWAFSGLSDTSGIFTRTVSVADIDVYTKAITSLVTWNTVGGRAQSVSLTTQLTAWR